MITGCHDRSSISELAAMPLLVCISILSGLKVSKMFQFFPYVFLHYCMKIHLLNKWAFRVFLTLMSMNVKNAVFRALEFSLS